MFCVIVHNDNGPDDVYGPFRFRDDAGRFANARMDDGLIASVRTLLSPIK